MALVDFISGSSYRLGAEVRLYQAWSVKFSGGGYFRNFNGLENTKGAIGTLALKKYINPATGKYLSADFLVKNQSFNWSTDTIRIAPDHIQTYRLDKHLWAISIKYGQAKVYANGFVFDWFVGLGLRYKNVSASLSPDEIKHRDPGDSQIVPFMTSVGHRVVPNVSIGFVVGYCFFKE